MKDSPAARPNPNEKLVRVFDTEQESEALVVHGLLESYGIDSDLTSLDAQQDILPGVGHWVQYEAHAAFNPLLRDVLNRDS